MKVLKADHIYLFGFLINTNNVFLCDTQETRHQLILPNFLFLTCKTGIK